VRVRPMIIRKAEVIDAEALLNMLKQLDCETKNMMYEPGERRTSIEEMKYNIANINASNSLMLIAEDKETVVGFLSADRGFANRIKHSAYIVIGILKSYRGKKIGTNLLEELVNWALDNEITRLELTVLTHNEGAISLYKDMGFKIEGVKEKSLIIDGKYFDEYYMAKLL
jgi:RimJ/RimL family protein N-acetyltransferase